MDKNRKELWSKIQNLIAIKTVKQNFVDAKLAQGDSVLRTADEKLAIGSKVTLISKDGAETDAPDGEVTLQDGTKVTIKGGVIDSISDPSQDTPPAKTEGTAKDAKMTSGNPDAQEGEMDGTPSIDMLAQIVSDLADRVSALEGKSAQVTAENAEMKSQLAAFGAQPGAKSITKEKVEDVKYDPEKFTFGEFARKYRSEKTSEKKDRVSVIQKYTNNKAAGTPVAKQSNGFEISAGE